MQYNYYDVTEFLAEKTDITAVVGGGWAVGRFTYESKSQITAKRQSFLLELFVEYKEITSGQLAGYMGISEQSARILLRKWIAEGFLQVANQAKKNRTYTLSEKYEDLIK